MEEEKTEKQETQETQETLEKPIINKEFDIPEYEQIVSQLTAARTKEQRWRIIRNTISSLIVVTALAVIISYVFLPVIRVTGTSMAPTLINGDILLCVKGSRINRGDIVAFSYNNKILLKRVIGLPGDNIDIDEEGVVRRNGEVLDEPYVSEIRKGTCDMEFPYQVPENRLFVMGDNRGVSIDSRSVTIGCISDEYILGKVLIRVYPFNEAGKP
ncbi:MAG: signal peptidase I [Lachnospira sp.]